MSVGANTFDGSDSLLDQDSRSRPIMPEPVERVEGEDQEWGVALPGQEEDMHKVIVRIQERMRLINQRMGELERSAAQAQRVRMPRDDSGYAESSTRNLDLVQDSAPVSERREREGAAKDGPKRKRPEPHNVPSESSPPQSYKTARCSDASDVHSAQSSEERQAERASEYLRPPWRPERYSERAWLLNRNIRIAEDPASPFADLVAFLRSTKKNSAPCSTVMIFFENLDDRKLRHLNVNYFREYIRLAEYNVAIKTEGSDKPLSLQTLVLMDPDFPFVCPSQRSACPHFPATLEATFPISRHQSGSRLAEPIPSPTLASCDTRQEFLGGLDCAPRYPGKHLPPRLKELPDSPFALLVDVLRQWQSDESKYLQSEDLEIHLRQCIPADMSLTDFYLKAGAKSLNEYLLLAQQHVDVRLAGRFPLWPYVRLGSLRAPFWEGSKANEASPRNSSDIPPFTEQCFFPFKNRIELHFPSSRSEGKWEKASEDWSVASVCTPGRQSGCSLSTSSKSVKPLSRQTERTSPDRSGGPAADDVACLPELTTHRTTPYNAAVDWLRSFSRHGHRAVPVISFVRHLQTLDVGLTLDRNDEGLSNFKQSLLIEMQRYVDLRLVHASGKDGEMICLGELFRPYWTECRSKKDIPSYEEQLESSRQLAAKY